MNNYKKEQVREIKFRAWDIKPLEGKAKMIYGIDEIKKFWDGIDLIDELLNPKRAGIPELRIMQFTGLKDKNGKEIFEGDILQSYPTQDVRFVVGFGVNGDNDSWGFTLESIRKKTVYSFETSVEKMEVIGNIYENPELLEEK